MKLGPLAAAVLLVAVVSACDDADKRKTYHYQLPNGEYATGMSPPPGSTILGEAGAIESIDRRNGTIVMGSSAPTDVQRVAKLAGRRPLELGILVVSSLLWALLVMRAIPPIFQTMELDFRGARSAVLSILAGVLILALGLFGLEWLWATIAWSPRMSLGRDTFTYVGWGLYALPVLWVVKGRVSVSLNQTIFISALYIALVVGFGLAMWMFGIPWILAQL